MGSAVAIARELSLEACHGWQRRALREDLVIIKTKPTAEPGNATPPPVPPFMAVADVVYVCAYLHPRPASSKGATAAYNGRSLFLVIVATLGWGIWSAPGRECMDGAQELQTFPFSSKLVRHSHMVFALPPPPSVHCSNN